MIRITRHLILNGHMPWIIFSNEITFEKNFDQAIFIKIDLENVHLNYLLSKVSYSRLLIFI